jgi:hypothetical protein
MRVRQLKAAGFLSLRDPGTTSHSSKPQTLGCSLGPASAVSRDQDHSGWLVPVAVPRGLSAGSEVLNAGGVSRVAADRRGRGRQPAVGGRVGRRRHQRRLLQTAAH